MASVPNMRLGQAVRPTVTDPAGDIGEGVDFAGLLSGLPVTGRTDADPADQGRAKKGEDKGEDEAPATSADAILALVGVTVPVASAGAPPSSRASFESPFRLAAFTGGTSPVEPGAIPMSIPAAAPGDKVEVTIADSNAAVGTVAAAVTAITKAVADTVIPTAATTTVAAIATSAATKVAAIVSAAAINSDTGAATVAATTAAAITTGATTPAAAITPGAAAVAASTGSSTATSAPAQPVEISAPPGNVADKVAEPPAATRAPDTPVIKAPDVPANVQSLAAAERKSDAPPLDLAKHVATELEIGTAAAPGARALSTAASRVAEVSPTPVLQGAPVSVAFGREEGVKTDRQGARAGQFLSRQADEPLARTADTSTPMSASSAPTLVPPFAAAAPIEAMPPIGAGAALAHAPSPEAAIERQLDVAADGEWLDQLARDIAATGGSEGRMRFRLAPEHLGMLRVELTQGDQGTTVRLTADNEAARAMLADAQPRLMAEARAQGVRIAETHVDLAGGQAGDPRRQEPQRAEPTIRTTRLSSTPAGAAETRPQPGDRYA